MQELAFNLADFRVSRGNTPRVPLSQPRDAERIRGPFLKGPIPLAWLTRAAILPGKSLHVGLAVWFEYGRRKKPTFRLSRAVLQRFGVARKAGYSGLEALEKAKLLKVARQHGKNPTITLFCDESYLDTLDRTEAVP